MFGRIKIACRNQITFFVYNRYRYEYIFFYPFASVSDFIVGVIYSSYYYTVYIYILYILNKQRTMDL